MQLTAKHAARGFSTQGILCQRFSPDSVNGSDSTAGLKRNIDKDDNKIIVTTIQKLNNLIKGEGDLITNGVGNHIGMQLTAKHAARGFSTQGILWENRRASKTKPRAACLAVSCIPM
jgi:hypothetical protein